jgi:hypothetical protein
MAALYLLRVREMQLLTAMEPELDRILAVPAADHKRHARARQLKELLNKYREEVI